MSWGISSK